MALYKFPGEVEFEGMIVHDERITPKEIENIRRNLHVIDGDVIIASYPRSGNTWLSEALFLIHSDGDFEMAKAVQHHDRIFFLELVSPELRPSNMQRVVERQSNGISSVMKTHLPEKYLHRVITEEGAKVVHVMRNPKDLLASFHHFYSNSSVWTFQGTKEDFLALWRHKRLIYGDPIDLMVSYWKMRHLPNILILTYEDTQQDLKGTLKKISKFLNKTPSDELLQKMCEHLSFDSMQKNDAVNLSHHPTLKGKFIRKGEVGGWKDELTEVEAAEIERFYAPVIKEFGLPIRYSSND